MGIYDELESLSMNDLTNMIKIEKVNDAVFKD